MLHIVAIALSCLAALQRPPPAPDAAVMASESRIGENFEHALNSPEQFAPIRANTLRISAPGEAIASGLERVAKFESAHFTYYLGDGFEIRDGVSTIWLSGGGGRSVKVEDTSFAAELLPDLAPLDAPDGEITAADAYLAQQGGLANTEAEVLKILMASTKRMLVGAGYGVTYLHPNHQGSTTVQTNDAGEVVARAEYYAYGLPRRQSSFVEDYSYTGQERDKSTGLSYHSARYLDVQLGRWVSPDPLFSVLGEPTLKRPFEAVEPYGYVSGNPVNSVDPSGLVGDFAPQSDRYASAVQSMSDEQKKGYVIMGGVALGGGAVGLLAEAGVGAGVLSSVASGAWNSAISAAGTAAGFVGSRGRAAAQWAAGRGRAVVNAGSSLVRRLLPGASKGGALVQRGAQISGHAADRMAQRGISPKMVDAALRKGTQYFDRLNNSVSHVLRGGYANGKNLIVGRNPVTNVVTTVMKNSKFKPGVLLPDGTARYIPLP